MKLVFKPEVGARRGLDHLCASGLGYRNGARVMQLNVAASRVADAIGCGGTIARSSIGSHDGQLGLFMEAAPGQDLLRYRQRQARLPDALTARNSISPKPAASCAPTGNSTPCAPT